MKQKRFYQHYKQRFVPRNVSGQMQPPTFSPPSRVVKARAGPYTSLQLPVTIANQQYKAVVDVGLPTSLISTALWQKVNAPLYPLVENEITRRVSMRTNLTLMGNTNFHVRVKDTVLELEEVLVYDFEEPEIFLNISAVSALGVIVDFQEGTFGLRRKQGVMINWTEDTILFPDDKLENFGIEKPTNVPAPKFPSPHNLVPAMGSTNYNPSQYGDAMQMPLGVARQNSEQMSLGMAMELQQLAMMNMGQMPARHFPMGTLSSSTVGHPMAREKISIPDSNFYMKSNPRTGHPPNQATSNRKNKNFNNIVVPRGNNQTGFIGKKNQTSYAGNKNQSPNTGNKNQASSSVQKNQTGYSGNKNQNVNTGNMKQTNSGGIKSQTDSVSASTKKQQSYNKSSSVVQQKPVGKEPTEELKNKSTLNQVGPASRTIIKGLKDSKKVMCVNCFSQKHTIYTCTKPIVKKCVFCSQTGHVRKDCPSVLRTVDLLAGKKGTMPTTENSPLGASDISVPITKQDVPQKAVLQKKSDVSTEGKPSGSPQSGGQDKPEVAGVKRPATTVVRKVLRKVVKPAGSPQQPGTLRKVVKKMTVGDQITVLKQIVKNGSSSSAGDKVGSGAKPGSDDAFKVPEADLLVRRPIKRVVVKKSIKLNTIGSPPIANKPPVIETSLDTSPVTETSISTPLTYKTSVFTPPAADTSVVTPPAAEVSVDRPEIIKVSDKDLVDISDDS